jgi:single-stranded-DNA-specific exonuclease
VVALTGENRTLVRRGLAALGRSPLPGIAAMIAVGGLKGSVTSGTIGYQLAPRINAAGRMDDARLALDVLLAPDVEAARPLAAALEQHNLDRRAATEEAVRQAVDRLAEEGEVGAAIILADGRWPLGLVGLISGRLTEEHQVPSFILNLDDGEARGSARSVSGFNVVEALDSCADLLSRYGGHAMAAGLALPAERLPALAERLKSFAAAARPEAGWARPMRLDGEVRLGELTPDEVRTLSVLEPFGEGNPAPRFCGRGLEIKSVNAFGVGGAHLKLWLAQDGKIMEAVAWNKGRYFQQYQLVWRAGHRLDVLYSPSVSAWDEAESVQLELEDIKGAARAVAIA